MKATLVITRGLPASGKTTWAREWVEQDRFGRARVNRDDLRHNLFGAYWLPEGMPEGTVTYAQHAAVRSLLAHGVSVVVDDTNLRVKHARAFADICQAVGAAFEVNDSFLSVPVDECIRRDLERAQRGERSVGADVIRSMHKRFLANGAPPLEVTLDPVVRYEPDVSLPRAWLVDVDGTLALMQGRGPFEWHRVGEDAANPAVHDLVRSLKASGDTIVVLSGRDGVCRPETEAWLREHGVQFDLLLMREAGDYRKDSVVKSEIFWRDVAPRFNVVGVLDDRNQVVEMWRDLGLFCAQVAPGDF